MKYHAANSLWTVSVIAFVFGVAKVEAQNVTLRLDPALLRSAPPHQCGLSSELPTRSYSRSGAVSDEPVG